MSDEDALRLIGPVKCSLCGEAIECRQGLDAMEEHWELDHTEELRAMKALSDPLW